MIPGLLAPMPALPLRPYVPGTPFTLWQMSGSFIAAQIAWNGYSIRQAITLSGANAGYQFRFTFDSNATLDHCSFELQDTNYNTLHAPKEITFNGGQSGFIAGASLLTTVSDWIGLPHYIDGTMIVVVIIDISPTSPTGVSYASATAGVAPFQSPVRAATYNIAAPTGTWHPCSLLALSKMEGR